MKSLEIEKPQKVRRSSSHRSGQVSRSGVVNYFIRSSTGNNTVDDVLGPEKLIQAVGAGLPVQEFNDLQAGLDVSAEKLAPMLGMSKATLHRQKAAGARLGSDVSDRIVRFASLLGSAIRALGDENEARQWLHSPQFGLGGAVPLDYAKTEIGAREVENLLGRIEYGVYS
jgi:putative toxin-antitoxin system antitoxin component (TIGR02293 family)